MSLSNSRLCLTFNLIVLVILARFTSAWNMASDETHKNDCYQKPSEDLTEDMISGAYLELHMGDHNHGDVCRISINNDFQIDLKIDAVLNLFVIDFDFQNRT